MDNNQEVKNKQKLTKLILADKWIEAEQLIKGKETNLIRGKEFGSKIKSVFTYRGFSDLIRYHNQEKNLWLKDLLGRTYMDEFECKELKHIITVAINQGYDQALSEIREALNYSPTNTDLYQVMQIIYFYKGDIEKYLEIENSIEYNALFDLVNQIGKLVEDEGKYVQAIKLINKHLEKYPEDHLMLSYKGVALYKQGDIEQAKETLKKSTASKQNKYAIYHLFEITKNSIESADALNFADQLISIGEEEIWCRENQLRRDGKKHGISDLWIPAQIMSVKLDKASIFQSLGKTQSVIVLLREILQDIEQDYYPKWQEACSEDSSFFLNASQHNLDTPGTELNKIYESASSMLSQMDPTYGTKNSSNGCFSVFVLLSIVISIIGITIS